MYAIESNKTQNLFPVSSFKNCVLGIELKFKPQFKLLIFSSQWFRAIYIYANNAKGIKTKLNHDIDNHKYLLVLYGQDCFGDAIASSIGYFSRLHKLHVQGVVYVSTFLSDFWSFYNYVFLNNYGIDRIQVLNSLASFFIKRGKKTYVY